MKRRDGAPPQNGRGGILELAFIGGPGVPARPDGATDLVLLATHSEGEAFWTCALWGSELHRTDFVHVAGPCRC